MKSKPRNIYSVGLFDVIEVWSLDYYLGRVLEHIAMRGHRGTRYRKEAEIQDLKAAREFLSKRIEQLEKQVLKVAFKEAER